MGDVAMTVPVLRALAQQHPEVKITMVSRPLFRAFFDDIPNIGFFEADLGNRHKGLRGLFRLYSKLKMLKVDAIADLHNVLRSKIIRLLFKLGGVETAAVDKARAEKKGLTRPKDKIFRQLLPITERYCNVFASLGFPVSLAQPHFPKPNPMTAEIEAVTGFKESKWIGIAPFAKHEGKVYPADLMREVIKELSDDNTNKLFLFGAGKEEIDILHNYAQTNRNIIVVAGKLSLKDELNLISNLDLMLSMDSANAHIAANFGIPVVTLWGATHPFAGFAPFNQPSENAITADREKYPMLPTSVYGNKKVEGYDDAMRTIAPDVVVEKIKSILRSPNSDQTSS
ncbi:MAG: lipopolysaccharide heptosyltransferase family protein [Flavobacterium sp.]|nr:MAG: lipopolysaccharide heptosyltransferase family protein [Flavobacterium sp.]